MKIICLKRLMRSWRASKVKLTMKEVSASNVSSAGEVKWDAIRLDKAHELKDNVGQVICSDDGAGMLTYSSRISSSKVV